jgi:MerR family redox-sensitive transcriptional activator SoxR
MPALTITAIARRARVSPSALRYYEKIGILPPAQRVGGRRRYDLSTLKQLQFITYTKQAGCSLRQIQALQEGAARGKAPARLWRDLAVEKAAELDQILFRVHQAQRRLATLARCRCRNLAECVDLLAARSENA